MKTHHMLINVFLLFISFFLIACAGDIKGESGKDSVSNMALLLSSGTLKITDLEGENLSSGHLGYITVPAKTAGVTITLNVESSPSLNDATTSSSSLSDFGFGITKAADWNEDAPFFIYVVNKDNLKLDGADGNSAFFISRHFNLKTTPTDPDEIGNTTTPPATDSQNAVLLLGKYTVADYTALPCERVGSFRMQWSASAKDWTIQPLNFNGDGMGQMQLERQFSNVWKMPTGQNGAADGNYFSNNGGTAPLFGSSAVYYMIQSDGTCSINGEFDQDGGVDGAGNVLTALALPYSSIDSTYREVGSGRVYTPSYNEVFMSYISPLGGLVFSRANTLFVENSDFTNGLRSLLTSARYVVN